jgi:hypothetical protein
MGKVSPGTKYHGSSNMRPKHPKGESAGAQFVDDHKPTIDFATKPETFPGRLKAGAAARRPGGSARKSFKTTSGAPQTAHLDEVHGCHGS